MKILNANDPIAQAEKRAEAWRELKEWEEDAKSLGREWAALAPEDVTFQNHDQILKACFLLDEGLLPKSAWSAFANVVMDTVVEAQDKKLTIKSLDLKPPRRGRTSDPKLQGYMVLKTKELIESGSSANEAYAQLAKELHKSPDTVRRTYERAKKRSRG